MTPVRIEERPDVVVDGSPGLGLRWPRTAVDESFRQGCEEALRDRIVPAVPTRLMLQTMARAESSAR